MLNKSEFLKSRRILVLLCVELLLILIGVAGLFGPRGVITGPEETDLLLGEGIPLSAGVYTARIYYEIGDNASGGFGVEAPEAPYRTLFCNNVTLCPGLKCRECQFYLMGSVDNLRISVQDYSDGTLEIKGVELVADTEGSRIYLFWVILACLLLDGVLMLSMYNRKFPIPPATQRAVFGIPGLALLSSLPVMVDYNIMGTNLMFHMMRIEALTDKIRQGEPTARIESLWLAGHGCASSIFCGDTFLVIPALFRLIGFTPDGSYRLFVVTVNLATAWISYACFRKCFRDKDIGMLGAVLYTLAPYRIHIMYNRAAADEYLAMIFLPLLALGFYRIYTEDPKKKGYLWNWVIPAAGFSGMLQSHTLSCGMAGLLTMLLCLMLWRKTFQRRILQVLALTAAMTILLNAWFLLPLLDLKAADTYLGHSADALIQSRGVLPAHWLYTLQAAGTSSRFAETGMLDTEPIGIGAALLICPILWLWLRARQDRNTLTKEQRAEKKAADTALILGCVMLFMSSRLFPWDFLGGHSRLFAALNESLQSPARLTGPAGICMVITACIAAKWALREKPGGYPKAAVPLLLTLISIVFSTYQLNDTLLTKSEIIRVYTAQSLDYSAVQEAQYAPAGTDPEHITYHDPVPSEGVSVSAYRKNGLRAEACVESTGNGGYIEFPMLYYKGYEAVSGSTSEKLSVQKGANADVRVLLPPDFSGEISVRYAGAWYWHAAEAVSVITSAVLLGWYIVSRRQKVKKRIISGGLP